jgi:hypothetical protein
MNGRTKDGKFTEGNSGRPKGAKDKKTIEWEEFGKRIIEAGVDNYAENLEELLESEDPKDKAEGMKRLEAIMEYFKPKLSRADIKSDVNMKIAKVKVTFENE